MNNLIHRKARITDLPRLIELLLEDELGATRESKSPEVHANYIKAFHKIDSDSNQYLMVVENNKNIIGMCHLTLIPSLTFMGSTRMQIESVRIASHYQGKNNGTWMLNQAIKYAKHHGAVLIQLTTNKERPKAKDFYEKFGFKGSHEGMKLYLNKTF